MKTRRSLQVAAIMSAVTDLTPLDFFFWGYVNDRVYKTAVNDIDHLKEKTQEVVKSGGPSSKTSMSNPGISKSGVKISSDVPGPVWRGSVLLEYQVRL